MAFQEILTPYASLVYKVLALYAITFIAVIIDLISGIRKSKLSGGKITHSYGFRKTVNKLARYFNLMLAGTVLDSLISVSGIAEQHGIPMIPYITFGVTFILCIIEGYSVWEKDEEKGKYVEAVRMTKEVIKSMDLDEITDKLIQKLEEKQNEKQIDNNIRNNSINSNKSNSSTTK